MVSTNINYYWFLNWYSPEAGNWVSDYTHRYYRFLVNISEEHFHIDVSLQNIPQQKHTNAGNKLLLYIEPVKESAVISVLQSVSLFYCCLKEKTSEIVECQSQILPLHCAIKSRNTEYIAVSCITEFCGLTTNLLAQFPHNGLEERIERANGWKWEN